MFKRFITIFAALMMVFTMTANAQTIEKPGAFENIYISINGGATTTGMFSDVPTPFFWDGAKSVLNSAKPFASIELGKHITPAVGFSVEGVGYYNTTDSKTIVDESIVFGNGKLNVFNWLGGYKGEPRKFEIVGVAGMGWGHDYVGNGQTWESTVIDETAEDQPEIVAGTDKNYVAYRTGLEFNANLGKAKAWQISFRPGVTWFNKKNGEYQSLPRFMDDARVNATLGVVYKFNNRSKNSHNFVYCPYSVTKAELDAALAKIKELEENPKIVEKEVIKETVVIKEVPVEKTNTVYNPMNVSFDMGSAVLTPAEQAKIREYVRSIDAEEALVVGSADSKTGAKTRNQYLAEKRANVVAEFLKKLGFKTRVEYTMDVDPDSAEASRAAIIDVN